MKNRLMALLLITALVITGLTGCRDFSGSGDTSDEEVTTTTADADEDTDAKDAGDEAEEDTEDEASFTTQDMSEGLEDDGSVKGIRALDYLTLPDFSQVVFVKSEHYPDQDTIDSEISTMEESFAEQVKDREVEDGDLVCIDYTGYVDGELLENGAATYQTVTAGSEDFIDDFLTQIIGHMPGDEFDVEVTFPDPYTNNEELSGKDATFAVTIHYISVVNEFTDEFIAENSEFMTNIFEREINCRADLEQYVIDAYVENEMPDYIIETILGEWDVDEMPEEALQVARHLTEVNLYTSYGITLDTYASYLGYEEEEIDEMLYEDAVKMLLYQAISESEGWTVTDADYEKITGTEDSSSYIEAYGRGYLSQYLTYARCMEWLPDQITIED